MHTRMHAHTRAHACTHACTHAHMHTHACTHTHAHTRTHTHTRTHAHTQDASEHSRLTPAFLPKRNRLLKVARKKDMWGDSHCSLIHDSPNLGMTHMCLSRGMHPSTVYQCNGIVSTNEEPLLPATTRKNLSGLVLSKSTFSMIPLPPSLKTKLICGDRC